MNRAICYLISALILFMVSSAQVGFAEETPRGYWVLQEAEFIAERSIDDTIKHEFVLEQNNTITDGYATMHTKRQINDVQTAHAEFTFDMPESVVPGEKFAVSVSIRDTSLPETFVGNYIYFKTYYTEGDFENHLRSDYFSNKEVYSEGSVSMTALPYEFTMGYYDILVSTAMSALSVSVGEMVMRYRYAYVEGEKPDTIILNGVLRDVEGDPMVWMAMRAGVCADPEAGRRAFDAGKYEDVAKWVTGYTDEKGRYSLEVPLPKGTQGRVGVILEGTLACSWPGSNGTWAFYLTDDSDGIATNIPMRVATYLEADLNDMRAEASFGPPSLYTFLNFQYLLSKRGWSLDDRFNPEPVSLHPSGNAAVKVRNMYTNEATTIMMSGEQRLAEASVLYKAARDAWFFGGATLGEDEKLSGANLPICLRSAKALIRESSYFANDSSDICVNIESCDSRNDDKGRFTVLHELGHAFDFISNGGALRTIHGFNSGDENHRGYMNSTTADSFIEGFATAFAGWVQLYSGYENPDVAWMYNLGYPYQYVAWGWDGRNEELCVAAFLYQTTFHFKDTAGYWALLKPARMDFYEYYNAIVNSEKNPDPAISRKHAIELGLFKMPYDGNGQYDIGEPYIDVNGNGRWDAAEAFEDADRSGYFEAGEKYTDTNQNGVFDDNEPYADLIFATDSNGYITNKPIRVDDTSLVVGEVGDYGRMGRKTIRLPKNGYMELTGEYVDSVLVTVSPKNVKAVRSMQTVSGNSIFLLVPGMYTAGTVQVSIPGGGIIYEGSIEHLNEKARSLVPGEALAEAKVEASDLAPEGTFAVATYADVSATGVMELVTLSNGELVSLMQSYNGRYDPVSSDLDWSTVPDTFGATQETQAPTQVPEPKTTSLPPTFPAVPDLGIEGNQDIVMLWTNANADAMQSKAKMYYVVFELEHDSVVTSIMTDHSMSGGAEPGQIMLFSESNEQWGPFQTVGKSGHNGIRNAYWMADTGHLTLPAGRYAITDSDPDTWSSNASSDNYGIAEVHGYLLRASAYTNPFTNFDAPQADVPDPQEEKFVGLWLSEPMSNGEQLLYNVLSDDSLVAYHCVYKGAGDGSVESLMDPKWECRDLYDCDYVLSGDSLNIHSERDVKFLLTFAMLDNDTVHLADQWGTTYVLHRASHMQADTWRDMNWRASLDTKASSYENSNPTEGKQPEGWFIGLWLSEPMENNEMLLLNVESEASLDYCFAFYLGDGILNIESLMDKNWKCLDLMVCDYDLSKDTLRLQSERGVEFVFTVVKRDENTVYLTDEWGATFTMQRATQEQADSWRSWNWRDDYSYRSDTELRFDEADGETEYDGEYTGEMDGNLLEEKLMGLWLSEPLNDGWQMMMYIIPDYWAEIYFCYYWGNGNGSIDSLTDSRWTFDETITYNYYIASDEMTFFDGFESSSTFWFSMPDVDTIELIDENGHLLILHRASLEQEISWLGWMQ